MKLLYALSESGDFWHNTFKKHLTEDFELHLTPTDPSLYRGSNENRIGFLGLKIDDIISCGNEVFPTLTEKTRTGFDVKGK